MRNNNILLRSENGTLIHCLFFLIELPDASAGNFRSIAQSSVVENERKSFLATAKVDESAVLLASKKQSF